MSEEKKYLFWRRIGFVSGILLLLAIISAFSIAIPIMFDIPHNVKLYRDSTEKEKLITMSVPRKFKVSTSEAGNSVSIRGEFYNGFDGTCDNTFIKIKYSSFNEGRNKVKDIDSFLSHVNSHSSFPSIFYSNSGPFVIGNTSFTKITLTYPILPIPPTYYVKFYETGYIEIHTQGVRPCRGREVSTSDIQSILDTIVVNTAQ